MNQSAIHSFVLFIFVMICLELVLFFFTCTSHECVVPQEVGREQHHIFLGLELKMAVSDYVELGIVAMFSARAKKCS